MPTVCAITGHRPTRFPWKYKENNTGCKRLKKRIHDQVIVLYEQGVRQFWVGGALGVDMWAGEIILRLKEQPEYGDIQLRMALPFEGYEKDWDERSKKRLTFLIQHSEQVVTVGQEGEPPAVCYRKRNEYMVDHADCLLAVYDDTTPRSGAGMTVSYAKRKGLSVIVIQPKTGTVVCFTNDANINKH